MKSKPLF